MSTNGRIAIIFNSINVTGLLTTLEEAYIYIGAPFSLFLSYPRLEELVRGEGDGFEYAHAKCLGVRPRPRSLPAPRLWPSIRLSSLARDPAAINKRRRDAAGQSRCRAECIGFCQTGEW